MFLSWLPWICCSRSQPQMAHWALLKHYLKKQKSIFNCISFADLYYSKVHSLIPFPPAPWSWILQTGFPSILSKHALRARFIFCSISASPLWTAPRSRSLQLSPWTYKHKTMFKHLKIMQSTDATNKIYSNICTWTEDAAPPPTPIRYTGPPIFTTSIPYWQKQQP